MMDGSGRHADLCRGNLHRAVGGEHLQEFALELRRPVMAGGGGDLRGIIGESSIDPSFLG